MVSTTSPRSSGDSPPKAFAASTISSLGDVSAYQPSVGTVSR
jgi:hypothetical protein